MLEPRTWQKIPGTQGVTIFPFMGRATVACANTFLLKSSTRFVVIDPGCDSVRVREIATMVQETSQVARLPVDVYLTHCHFDHFAASSVLMDAVPSMRLGCHSIGADALGKQDSSFTTAYLYSCKPPPTRVDLHLISQEGNSSWEVPLCWNDHLEVLHTPGHSPDSLSYRAGEFLFVGDLSLATNPGIAGLPGWDPASFLTSIERLMSFLDSGRIRIVFPGHGYPLTVETTKNLFEEMRASTLRADKSILIDQHRADYLSQYAKVLLEETSTIFAIIGRQILKVAYYLDKLGEYHRSQELMKKVNLEEIEEIVRDFRQFAEHSKALPCSKFMLFVKATQFVHRINRYFAAERVEDVILASLLRRCNRLLNGFAAAVRGFKSTSAGYTRDVNASLARFLASLTMPPYDEKTILDKTDKQEEFVQELVRRIAYTSIYSDVKIDFQPDSRIHAGAVDMVELSVVLETALEQLVLAGVRNICIKTVLDIKKIIIRIRFQGSEQIPALREAKRNYLQLSVNAFGGCFRESYDKWQATIDIEFPTHEPS